MAVDGKDASDGGAALVAVLLGVALAYSGVLRAGFVWDDLGIVVGNSLTADLSRWPEYFVSDLWRGTPDGSGGTSEGDSGYYRPLMVLSLALERRLFGLSPWVAHVHSVLWHLLATAMVWRLLRRVLGENPASVPPLGVVGASAAGALLFGLHPIQSEAVIWVAARNDLMAAALGMVALDRGLQHRPTLVDRGIALLATILAGLTKESVVLLPLLLACLHHAVGWRLRDRKGDYPALVLGIALVLVMRMFAGVHGAGMPPAEGWRLLASRLVWVWGELGAFVFVPWPLSVAHVLEYLNRGALLRVLVGGLLLVLGFGAALVKGGPRGRAAVGWFVLAVAPAVISVADKGWIGERYLYLGLVGPAWWVAGWLPRRAAVPGVVLAVGMGLLVQVRTLDWTDDVALWSAAWRHTPSPFVADGLGRAHRADLDPEASLVWFSRALDDPEAWSESCVQLVSAANRLDKGQLAVQLAEWASAQGCGGSEFSGHHRLALAAAGRWDRVALLLAGPPVADNRGAALVEAAHWVRLGDPRAGAIVQEWAEDGTFAEQVERLAGQERRQSGP